MYIDKKYYLFVFQTSLLITHSRAVVFMYGILFIYCYSINFHSIITQITNWHITENKADLQQGDKVFRTVQPPDSIFVRTSALRNGGPKFLIRIWSPISFSFFCGGVLLHGLDGWIRENLGDMDRARGSRQGLRTRFTVDPKILGQSQV